LKLRVRRLIVYVSNTMKRNTENYTRIVLDVLIFKQCPRCTHWLHSVMTAISIRQEWVVKSLHSWRLVVVMVTYQSAIQVGCLA